ncbi:UDP-N-acetylmuramate--L-alanine ligase [Candidatus Parcubacteria bacterium]|nr:UDP-N-acetylmuramate--L-alanine ligase [Candidatus Parcubacteria bacterium]
MTQHTHFIGIGGIGVSAMARLFLHRGCAVSGSDLKRSEITTELERLGAAISIGHATENIPTQTELVVYSPAVPSDNPERAEAERRGIPQRSYPEALGALMANRYGIAVSGTNGKTTTTALLGHILVESGLNPTVVVGSRVGNFDGSNLRVGSGQYVVVEGCEYRRHFLNLRPRLIALTNIEVDHLDYFKDFDDIKSAFREYVALLTPEGILVYNRDDPAVVEVVQTSRAKKIAYGASRHYNISIYDSDGGAVDVQLISRAVNDGGQSLRVRIAREEYEFQLRLPGEIYAFNALAAIAAAHALGVRVEEIQKAVASFRGTWRRFEIMCGQNGPRPFDAEQGKFLDTARSGAPPTGVGGTSYFGGGAEPRTEGRRTNHSSTGRSRWPSGALGKIIVSDYAHHPTAVRETIRAAREFFPGRRILAAFQPHQRNRTQHFLDGFVEALALADQVIVSEIFDVSGREENIAISSREIVSCLQRTGRPAQYGADLPETERLIRDELGAVDVVIIMGAGDIHTLASRFC